MVRYAPRPFQAAENTQPIGELPTAFGSSKAGLTHPTPAQPISRIKPPTESTEHTESNQRIDSFTSVLMEIALMALNPHLSGISGISWFSFRQS